MLYSPSDIILKPLSESDVPLVNKLWPNRHSGSLFFMHRIRRWNRNIGAYKVQPDGTGEILVGWCLVLHSGALGVLQVREEYQGQGLGKLITAKITQQFATEDNKDTFAYVGVGNESSKNVFERLNFDVIGGIYWLRTFPVGKDESIWTGDVEGDQ